MFDLTNDKLNKGDLTPFTIYFLELIEMSLMDLINYFSDQIKKLEFYDEKINEHLNQPIDHRKALFIAVQATVFGDDGIDVNELSIAIKKSVSTTRKIVNRLCDDGFLLKKKSRPVLYNANLDKISEL